MSMMRSFFKIVKLNLWGKAQDWFKQLNLTPLDWESLMALLLKKIWCLWWKQTMGQNGCDKNKSLSSGSRPTMTNWNTFLYEDKS